MNRIHPDLFAYLALVIWPVVTFILYSRLPIARATLWTILAAYLLLPVGAQINIPMIPAFTKETIPNLAAWCACYIIAHRKVKLFPRFGFVEAILIVLIVSPLITSLLNGDPIVTDSVRIPGVGLYDGLSAVAFRFIFMLPFFLGRQFLYRFEDNIELMRVLVISGLAYSVLMLFEVRMSPQLSTWIYGYFPGSFLQTYRDWGFRPVVFLAQGLVVAFFAMTTAVAAVVLMRIKLRVVRVPNFGIAAYLSFVLVLCKTLSAILYAALLMPLTYWASPRTQVRVAVILALITFCYPLLRMADLIPTQTVVEMASSVSAGRAASVNTRFVQEDRLLKKAWERRWFGWGRYGRNRLYTGENGRDNSITDGYWVIIMGEFGLVGYFALFGLLAFSVIRAAGALRFAKTIEEGLLVGSLALIVAINMFDLLPNSNISPWSWLLAGALLGRAEALSSPVRGRVGSNVQRAKPYHLAAGVISNKN